MCIEVVAGPVEASLPRWTQTYGGSGFGEDEIRLGIYVHHSHSRPADDQGAQCVRGRLPRVIPPCESSDEDGLAQRWNRSDLADVICVHCRSTVAGCVPENAWRA